MAPPLEVASWLWLLSEAKLLDTVQETMVSFPVAVKVNAPPNFYYHYHKKDGVFPVAVHVLRRLLVERNGVSGTLEAGLAPRVVLRATHEGALAYCSLADLKRYAVDLS